jgi:3-oxoacyl-[acyl-carrier-protein] synthase-3
MVRKLLEDIGVAPEKGVYTHPIYGNTASASVAVTLNHLLSERPVKHGDKLVLGSAAAGFSMVFIAAEWCASEGSASQASVP